MSFPLIAGLLAIVVLLAVVLVIAGILWDGLRRSRPWAAGRHRRREEPDLHVS